jgi:hypothetical protein
MLYQTVDSLLPLLAVLQQPAFCLRQDGTVCGNAMSIHLRPSDRVALPGWLGENTALYEQWDRHTTLTIPVCASGISCTATVQALADGDLFLLSECSVSAASGPIGTSSQVLSESLSKLTASFQNMLDLVEEQENLTLASEAAGVTRNLFRMTRLAQNLSTYDAIQRDEMVIRPTRLSMYDQVQPMLEEIASAIQETGNRLQVTLPRENLRFCADWPVLERALLNLLDNALLHGYSGQTIDLQISASAFFVMFRITGKSGASANALATAFHRLDQRGIVPDPHWGMGLGLPIALHIARLHGGTLAIEDGPDGQVSVILSVSKKLAPADNSLQSPMGFDRTGGLDPRLLELSDVLPVSLYAMQL